MTELLSCLPYLWSKKVHYTLRGYYYFNLHISFLFCLLLINLFLFYVLLYEQTGTKATEIHSNQCLYCDTTFPQFYDLIKHSRENHSYHCYYCKTTFVLFEEVIKQSTENHGSLMLKVKYLELNPFSGHYGYKSQHFKVIPEKIKALVPVCW
jgi:hypothetical protein